MKFVVKVRTNRYINLRCLSINNLHFRIHTVGKFKAAHVYSYWYDLIVLYDLMHFIKSLLVLSLGERPYKCTYCERCFTQGKSLKFHLRRHTEEKPHCKSLKLINKIAF